MYFCSTKLGVASYHSRLGQKSEREVENNRPYLWIVIQSELEEIVVAVKPGIGDGAEVEIPNVANLARDQVGPDSMKAAAVADLDNIEIRREHFPHFCVRRKSMKRIRLTICPVEIVGPLHDIGLYDHGNCSLDRDHDRNRDQQRPKTGNK